MSADVALASALTSSRPVRLVTTSAANRTVATTAARRGSCPLLHRYGSTKAATVVTPTTVPATIEYVPPSSDTHPARVDIHSSASTPNEATSHGTARSLASTNSVRRGTRRARPSQAQMTVARARKPDTAAPAARWSAGA